MLAKSQRCPCDGKDTQGLCVSHLPLLGERTLEELIYKIWG